MTGTTWTRSGGLRKGQSPCEYAREPLGIPLPSMPGPKTLCGDDVIIMSFVLNHTKIGRYTFAIGSNKEATKLAGVNVKFYHIAAYTICGFFAGLAAIAYSATYVTIYPGSGAGFEMDAIAGAIVGGVSASGGVGSIFGAFLGVLVISLMKVGLPFIGLQANWQQIITGLVLIGAILIDVVKKKK